MQSKTKRILLIVDGLGDLPVAELGNRTPLEAAHTPNLDHFAALGGFGLVDPIAPGKKPNTDSGTSFLMGMEAEDAGLLRRGPIEAAGAGRVLRPGEVALRANFATAEVVNDTLRIIDRRAGRDTAGLDRLASEIREMDLGDGVVARFFSTDQHRGVLILSGEGLDAAVSSTDPGDSSLPAALATCRAMHPEAERTADKINRFVKAAHRRLVGHPANAERIRSGLLPANCIITRGAGTRVELRNRFGQMGWKVALVAGCNTVLGLGRLFDFELLTDPRFTADTDTDLDLKIAAAKRAAEDYDVSMIHIKAPDVCAHDRDPMEKMRVIERLDTALAGLRGWHGVLGLSADHTTDSNSGRHTSDPVPSLLARINGTRPPGTEGLSFGESLCREGNLVRQNSRQFLRSFLEA